jgi:hypothetical protein
MGGFMHTKFGLRQLVTWILLLLGLAVLIFLTTQRIFSDSWLQSGDFVEYWAAGRLNITDGNPFDPQQMEALQLKTGRTEGIPIMMWNPPWMLALVMPFGAMNYNLGRVVWLFFNLALVFACIELLWCMYGGAPRYRWIGWLVGLCFEPVLQTMLKGQSGILLLMGIVGFLYFIEHQKDFWAGVLLMLATLKPHTLYLVFVALLLWSWKYRRWRAVLGLAMTLGLAVIVVWSVNPLFLQQYLYALANFQPVDFATPTIGGALRLLFGTQHFWMQFVGPTLGILWMGFYWKRHADSWNWVVNAPLLVVVSMVTTAYGWTFDQTVALVAIIAVFAAYSHHRWTICVASCVGLFIVINFLLIQLKIEYQLWWTGTALLAWYELARYCSCLVLARDI